MSAPVYELRIALQGISPAIWRRFRVHSDMNLQELHGVIQSVMGWENTHLFCFRHGGTTYTDDRIMGMWAIRAREITVADALAMHGGRLVYLYDFGDGWNHHITLRDVLDPSVPAPLCLAGARACPPEDCGGVFGYLEMLDALADPSHESREEILDWLGEHFDPEEFSVDDVNEQLGICSTRNPLPPDSIAGVIQCFLRDESRRVAPSTVRRYEGSLSLLLHAINVYQSAGGEERPVVETAGMDVFLAYLPEYFNYFLPRKTFATKGDLTNLRATLRRLVAWMAETDRMEEEDARGWRREIADRTSRGLEAAEIRWMSFTETPPPIPRGEVQEAAEEHFTISRVEPRRLWIDHPEDARRLLELEVTEELSAMCREGMDLALALVKVGGQWYLEDVYNAYPVMGPPQEVEGQ